MKMAYQYYFRPAFGNSNLLIEFITGVEEQSFGKDLMHAIQDIHPQISGKEDLWMNDEILYTVNSDFGKFTLSRDSWGSAFILDDNNNSCVVEINNLLLKDIRFEKLENTFFRNSMVANKQEMNLTGQWSGTVIYGKEYRKHQHAELYFDLDIMQDHDKITGIAVDTGGVGVSPDPADITGTFAHGQMNFNKQYRSYHFYHRGGTKIDQSRSGNVIQYTGIFLEEKQVFKGDWYIEGRGRLFGIIPFKYKNTGTWMMKRNNIK
jgi:hypothetical protein